MGRDEVILFYSALYCLLKHWCDFYWEIISLSWSIQTEDYYLQTLTVYRQISQGADSVGIANTLYNLANNYSDMEQYNKAEDYYLQALTVYRQISQGADSVDIADTLSNLAINYMHMEQYNKAEDYYLQALTVYRQISQDRKSTRLNSSHVKRSRMPSSAWKKKKKKK